MNAALETSKGAGLLPEGFENLECASEWSLRTETERIKHRQQSSYAAITEFRDAVLPELPRVFEYLNAKDLRTLSVRDENLLFLTLALVFGVVGLAGKDFDMPVAVLSCLSLGMAIDFAIHFVSRYRERWQREAVSGKADIDPTLRWTIAWPGKGIVRNAALFAIAFSVMIFAPLTPYITVGAFILAMMVLSALVTITLLPALIKALKLEGQ